MLPSLFRIQKDFIKNSMKINLNSEKLKNKNTDVIKLIVFLSLSYHLESFEFLLKASTRKNKETNNLEFNMGDILETIFSYLGQKYINSYFLSYYMNNSNSNNNEETNSEISKDNIKTYNYFGEINLKTIKNSENLFFNIPKDNTIYLKLWQKIKNEDLLDPIFFEENEEEYSDKLFQEIDLDEEEEEKKNEKSSGRIKEKTIGYAIIKVCKWEKIREKTNNITLDEAAKDIGMAKKTLDDYKNQIKLGKEKNFNFNKYYKCKINVLKDFNKGKIKLDG